MFGQEFADDRNYENLCEYRHQQAQWTSLEKLASSQGFDVEWVANEDDQFVLLSDANGELEFDSVEQAIASLEDHNRREVAPVVARWY